MDKNILKRLGIKIGHFTNLEDLTGLTVFIAEKGADKGTYTLKTRKLRKICLGPDTCRTVEK